MSDSENSNPELNGSMAPSAGLLPPLNVPIDTIKSSHQMLTGFREAVREGTYQGKYLILIAQGLMFLDSLIGQSQAQLERAKAEQKEAINKAKEQITRAGGEVHG